MMQNPLKPNERVFKKRRMALVEELESKGIRDKRVLAAFENVARHKFVDSALAHRAYEDTALPIEMGQTISQPFTVAKQTELMEVSEGDKVLEIGTGSGYQAAILCELGAKVYSVERHQMLYNRSREILEELGYRPNLKCGDGTMGWSAYAPYMSIVVTAGAPVIPESLKSQLDTCGRLVVPVGDEEKQAMYRITRHADGHFEEEKFSIFKFVPLIGKQGWNL
ncbi:protein-L-isoaspartate(D-aspartate) O-methyltransferase [Natronogracilivirgula saccharolytica]|uniref:Protein-L-isoaspartate O-methyltransferase n=2 Tax=Natronogracilivirga saccharolytica TaxID=2812953 RepID=A0A8J7UX56_9BACT|nr:protein-L-isoaspartate(D-aspartate) O-methyltransferase [Natronogracilivirga saccharolytica]MBP3192954.1 protein-L-isoaspartate(D-aspartate) O-methyltransferase [Natronogracilivirga saccharolytica]